MELAKSSRWGSEMVEVVAKLFEGVRPKDFDSGWYDDVHGWCDGVKDDGKSCENLSPAKVDGFELLRFSVDNGDTARP
jgi:hypothetical protein